MSEPDYMTRLNKLPTKLRRELIEGTWDVDPVPLCPVCGKPAPVRAWCSAECEAKDGA